MFDAVEPAYEVTSCNFNLIRHFAFPIQHYNVNNGCASIFVGWMYETDAVLNLDEQVVCLYCCVWVIEFGGVINWFEYTTIILITALHWSLLVECMKRVSCWPWTNSAYVCIPVCDSERVVTDVGYNRTYEAPSCKFSPMRHSAFRIKNTLQFYNGCALIFVVGWMYGKRFSCWSWTISAYVFINCCVSVWSNSTLLLIGGVR